MVDYGSLAPNALSIASNLSQLIQLAFITNWAHDNLWVAAIEIKPEIELNLNIITNIQSLHKGQIFQDGYSSKNNLLFLTLTLHYPNIAHCSSIASFAMVSELLRI